MQEITETSHKKTQLPQPGNDSGRRYSLITVLGSILSGVTVFTSLLTAFTLYKVYDQRLTDEFQDRVHAEAQELSRKLDNLQQEVDSQLRYLSLDNSIRVTLMLGVEYQLKERLSEQPELHRGGYFFIKKEGSSNIYTSNEKLASQNHIHHLLTQDQGSGHLFRTDSNFFYIGFTRPIERRNQRLGLVGTIQPLSIGLLLGMEALASGARLYTRTQTQWVDVKSGERLAPAALQVEPVNKHGVHPVRVSGHRGYLVPLEGFPDLQYFLPSAELEQARNEGVVIAVLLSAGGAMLGIVLALWLTRLISRPLRSLEQTARNIAAGERTSEQLTQAGEIEELRNVSEALLQIVHTMKDAEQDISRSHQNLESVLDNMDSLVYISDMVNHEILFINRYGKRVFGEVVGQKCWQVLQKGQTGECRFCTNKQLVNPQGQASGPIDWKARNTRNRRWYEFRDQAIPWFGQRMVRMEIATDVTEREMKDDQLRLSAAVFDTAAEAVMITDRRNIIQKVNRAFCEITGYTESEVLGREPGLLSSGQHETAFYKKLWKALREHGYWQGEIWSRRKSGEAFPEWLSITAVYNEGGKVKHYVSLFSDITKRKMDEEKIRYQANYDSLTGLPNRNLFLDRFSSAMELAKRNQTHVALMFIDLDQFKHVNDTLGHPAGDQLLQQASKRLLSIMRKSDTVARLGGDEFTVILPNVNELTRVEDVASKILRDLSMPYSMDENDAFVSASIGVTVYPQDGHTVEDLLRNADSAMYRAKEAGRNNVRFFTLEMNEQASKRRMLESALRRAVDEEALELYYQPVLETGSGRLVGVEALLRWNLEGYGQVSPVEFIPLAEDTGLIVPIGEWVLETACLTAKGWQDTYGFSPRLAVNLSSRQFQRGGIPKLLNRVINKSGFDPNNLTLEITESLLLNDNREILDVLQEISDMGIRFAIDDFGTGYSSLSYLKRFPVSILKIDRSFIAGLPKNPEDVALVDAILSMAESLNLSVVAEGVENEQQLQHLQQKRCELVQGFYLYRPMSEGDLVDQLLMGEAEVRKTSAEA